MSLPAPSSSVEPRSARPVRRPEGRFLIVWAILLGILVAGWAGRDLSRPGWIALVVLLYLGPVKVATLIGLTAEERRRLTPGRLIAYFLWLGVQPRAFLPGYSPLPAAPVPTWRGCLRNALAGAAVLWGVPLLLPEGTPLLVRAWTGLVGVALLRLFAGFDVWTLVFRWLGFPVEKAWFNPLAATSVRDFWGRRWNRIMSSLLRDLLFRPLARWVGVVGAAVAVFLYSGVVHEFMSVLAGGGYGGPSLYFAIQGAAFLLEGTHRGRVLTASPLVGWCWTALVVVGPVGLILPPALLIDGVVPLLREASVPGLAE
jgi:hypothetical protein